MSRIIYIMLLGTCTAASILDDPACSLALPSNPGFASPQNCESRLMIKQSIRVVYMDSAYVTVNSAAQTAAQQMGIPYSCDDPSLAVPDCFVAANWKSGWIGAFMWDVFQAMGINSNIVAMTQANFTSQTDPKNPASIYHGVSSYTRCVAEIYLGNVDLCVGDFWETEERRILSSFTTPLAVDQFMLVTLATSIPEVTASQFTFPAVFDMDSLSNILLPFDRDVWLMNIFMVFFGGTALWFIESTHPAHKQNPSTDPTFHGLSRSVFATAQASLAQGQFHIPFTNAGKVVLVGISFYCFIVEASYTAALAGSLASEITVPGIVKSIQQPSIYPNTTWMGKLCVLEAMAGIIPVNFSHVVVMDDWGPMFEKLDGEGCSAAVTSKDAYLLYVQGEDVPFTICADPSDPRGLSFCQNGGPTRAVNLNHCSCKNPALAPVDCPADCPDYLKFCNIIPSVDQSTLQSSLNFALPVRDDYADALSYVILDRSFAGDVIDRRKSELVNVVPDRCSETPFTTTIVNTQAKVSYLVGAYFWPALNMSLGLLLHCYHLFLARGDAGASDNLKSAPHGDNSKPRVSSESRLRRSESGSDYGLSWSLDASRESLTKERIRRALSSKSTGNSDASPAGVLPCAVPGMPCAPSEVLPSEGTGGGVGTAGWGASEDDVILDQLLEDISRHEALLTQVFTVPPPPPPPKQQPSRDTDFTTSTAPAAVAGGAFVPPMPPREDAAVAVSSPPTGWTAVMEHRAHDLDAIEPMTSARLGLHLTARGQ